MSRVEQRVDSKATTTKTNDKSRNLRRVSVIVPSLNRPALLMQAIESVAKQTYPESEIIIVDDGSMPAVDLAKLDGQANGNITLVRNESPHGQARSRERGEKLATGEFIFHLDDDDRLSPELLARGISVFDAQPDLDVVFFNVKGFGERADSFDRAQRKSLERVLELTGAIESEPGVVRFESSIFPALLRTVPMAFQRPMARRQAWREVTNLRRRAYGSEDPLRPPLRESEWAIYAAAVRRVALVTDPLYLQRCDGQGLFSIESKREAAERANLEIFEHLFGLSKTEPLLAGWRQAIKEATARCYFDHAYARFHRGSRFSGAGLLLKALMLHPSAAYLKFGLRMLLPRRD